jgi:hypothetical protein
MLAHTQRAFLLIGAVCYFAFFTGCYDETILFFRVVEDTLAKFRVRMRLQLMCFGDPKNQQAVAVPGM